MKIIQFAGIGCLWTSRQGPQNPRRAKHSHNFLQELISPYLFQCNLSVLLTNLKDRVQNKAAQFTNHTKDADWETMALCRTLARLCTLFKGYSGKRARRAIRDMLRRPFYLNRVDHVRKISDRKQRRNCSFVYSIKNWNQLPAEALGTFPCKPKIFKNRGRKTIINGVKWKE